MTNPRVFISYSHDSVDHKRWVGELGTWLRQNGIDVVLDQWDIGPGDDVTLFMESEVAKANRVLVICSDEYVRKANAGLGGVGYERMIVTSELVNSIGTKKFIPVVRNSSGAERVPRFLSTRIYVDLSDNRTDIDSQQAALLRELHSVPPEKPPLGKNPFARNDNTAGEIAVAKIRPDAHPGGVDNVARDESSSIDPLEIYRMAVDVAKRMDTMGWRQLVKSVSHGFATRLATWRKAQEANPPRNEPELYSAVDSAIELVSPKISLALAGVESSVEKFRDQRALFDDIYRIAGWSRSGESTISDLPDALGFVYQSLHGALSWETGQQELAFQLADMEVRTPQRTEGRPLREHRELMGWPDSLGHSCTISWRFIFTAAERWPWLIEVFGTQERFQEALVTYYLSLAIDEFALSTRSEDIRKALLSSQPLFSFDIPLTFAVDAPSDVRLRAIQNVRSQLPLLRERWNRAGVDLSSLASLWPGWMRASYGWLRNVYPHRDVFLAYQDLLKQG